MRRFFFLLIERRFQMRIIVIISVHKSICNNQPSPSNMKNLQTNDKIRLIECMEKKKWHNESIKSKKT